MADYVDEYGRTISVRHESYHPRGYFRRCEPRPGVTQDDPWRYRRYSIEELRERGDIEPGTPDTAQIRGDLYAAARSSGLSSPRRARLLGAFREAKQGAYYQRRHDLGEALQAAGVSEQEAEDWLDSWDEGRDLRVVHEPGGRHGHVAVVQDGDVLVELDARQWERSLAELQGELEAWEAIADEVISDEELLEALEAGELF